jgi:hypothetical protein
LALRECKRIDVVAFNGEGDIVLVECKLVTNRMSTRTALGQAGRARQLALGTPHFQAVGASDDPRVTGGIICAVAGRGSENRAFP